MKLFEDDDTADLSKIEINQEFARRYEHNKKREDLHRLEDLKKRGVVDSDDDSSDSEDSDDDNETLDPKKDLKFFDALLKVKKQDPLLKQKDVPLFDSEDEDEEEGSEVKEKKKKPMYLKDVTTKHLIEEGAEFHDNQRAQRSYRQEQEAMKREFLAAAADGDDDDDFLKVKEASDGEVNADEGGAEFEKKLDEYFGEEAEKDENASFLKEYFMKKMWIDKDKALKLEDGDLEEVSEDEEELEKQEEYEAGFNFRFQENAGDRVMGHARTVDGSVRKKVNARKEQRKSKEERMRIAEEERKQELKHLKNLKKKEIKEKINKIKQYAGIGEEEAWLLNEDNLEEDFDPEEYDRIMKAAFDDEYYNAEDANPEKIDADEYEDEDPDNIEKPDFDKEDELLGLPKGWDKVGSSDGFSAVRERLLKQKSENDTEEEEDDDEDEEEGSDSDNEDEDEDEDSDKEMKSDHDNEEGGEEGKEPEEGKRKRRKKLSLLKRAKEAMLDEYYKLDYEDTIGDLKTRFKYAKIKPNRYGLSTSEILMLDDKDLNQYVSLKKIAPYCEKEYKVKDSKRYQQKLKIKELLQQEKLDVKKSGKKRRSKDGSSKRPVEEGDNADVEPKLEESKTNDGSISRKAKRRRREAELKLPTSRLEAYGKISTKPSKKKHKKET